MIVRNEERYLAPCLESIRSLVDEIVIVDTGSIDLTRTIASDSGARVFQFSWQDDFSTARNFALDQATSDWILYIDADERVRPCDPDAVRADIASQDLLGAFVRFRPRTGFTSYPEMRLFRRDPRIRFHGAMHETFRGDIDRLVLEGAGTVGDCRLAIDHVGYDGDQSHKLDRNIRLLLKQIAADPDRAYLRWHLGSVYLALSRTAEAEAAWMAGAELAARRRDRLPGDALCTIELAKLRLARGEDADSLLDDAEKLQPGNWLVKWLRAKALMAADDYERATAIFAELAAVDAAELVDHVAYDERIFGAGACAEIAHGAFRLARYDESVEWYAKAEALEPSSREFRVKRMLAAARA